MILETDYLQDLSCTDRAWNKLSTATGVDDLHAAHLRYRQKHGEYLSAILMSSTVFNFLTQQNSSLELQSALNTASVQRVLQFRNLPTLQIVPESYKLRDTTGTLLVICNYRWWGVDKDNTVVVTQTVV